MSITAVMPSGVITATAYGLHQWDYGRELRILADDLPTMVEVHFACPGMTEAIVRVANVSQDVATVSIPDKCLEQTAPIQAWVVAKGETSGYTLKEITLPIIARAKPAALVDPAGEAQAVTKYDELFALAERVVGDYKDLDSDIKATAEAVALSEGNVAALAGSAATSARAASTSATNAAASASAASEAATAAENAAKAAKAEFSLSRDTQVFTIGNTALAVEMPAEDVMLQARVRTADASVTVDFGTVHLSASDQRVKSALGFYFDSLRREYYFVDFSKDCDEPTRWDVRVYQVVDGEPSVYQGTSRVTALELQVLGYKEATQ